MKRLGVLTGGGDSPGINAAIRAIVRKSYEEGIEVIGYDEGWLGVIGSRKRTLKPEDVSGILPVGGAILGSSRTNPFKKDEGPTRVKEVYKKNKLDALIVIGGDDTLGVAHRLKNHGINAIGIPQTIDNDIAETEYSIGFDSAIRTVTDALDSLHTTAYTHHRILILEVMGRDTGWIGLIGGLAGGADVILVPEREFKISQVKERIEKRMKMGKHFSLIVISEGAKPAELDQQISKGAELDEFGHVRLGGIGHYVADQLREIMELPVRVTTLAYLQRGGVPTAFDRVLATRFGAKAVELAMEGTFDVMTALRANKIVPVKLGTALAKLKPIDEELLNLADLFY